MPLSESVQAFEQPASDERQPALAVSRRYPSIDVARGIIMMVMAIDHASMFWNAGKSKPSLEGGVGLPPVEYADWMQQLTREITHICAPGFQFLAGMGLAIFVWRRLQRGVPGRQINRDLILRGVALCACDFILMYWASGSLPFAFLVLACIGCSFILFAGLRYLPTLLIGLLSLASILAVPLYLPEGMVPTDAASYPLNLLLYVAIGAPDGRSFLVIYPVLPWIGCFGLGWCLGQAYERGLMRRAGYMTAIGVSMMCVAFLLRWFGGFYADRMPLGEGPLSAAFWAVSKYPPSPVFILATLGMMIIMLNWLRRLDAGTSLATGWRIPLTYGRTPLFFFIAHFYVLALYPALTMDPSSTGGMARWGLGATYAVWLAALVLLFAPCIYYHRLRTRHGRILHYF